MEFCNCYEFWLDLSGINLDLMMFMLKLLNAHMLCIWTSFRVGCTPESWFKYFSISTKLLKTPISCNVIIACSFIFFIFSCNFFPFATEKDVKMVKKMILTSQLHVKHQFAGQNTQLNVLF